MPSRIVNAGGVVDPLNQLAISIMKSITVMLVVAAAPFGWMIYVTTDDPGCWLLAATFWVVLMTLLLVTIWTVFLRYEDKILLLVEQYD